METFGRRSFVVTADESCMHNYNMSFMAGFLACTPRDQFPDFMKKFIEKKFFSDVPATEGVADIAILAVRKIEAYLNEVGFTDVAVATPGTAAGFSADVFFVSTMDPFGIGPATTTMTGLAGGREPFNKFFFRRLVTGIRASNPDAKIIVGGPGAWEFTIFPEKQKELSIDCVFEGAIEGAGREFFDDALKGDVPEKFKAQGMRPRPFHTMGAAFWGMTEISRGCGRGCQFCDFELMSGFDWLPKDFIVKEAEINAKSPLVGTITLLSEDTIRYGTPRGQWKPTGDIVELVKELKKLGKPLSFTHCCLATALANPKAMEDFSYHAGLNERHLSGFQTGIESGSPRMMKRYMTGKLKPWSPEDWPEVVKQGMAIMIDNYVIPHATLVLGLEGETPEDTVKTTELVDDLKDYPSLILPLFFVPLSILKDRFFLAGMMTPEQKELLMASTRHTAKWARKLPNWSGSLGFFDRIAFMTGAASHLGGWALQGMEIAKDEEGFEYVIQDDQCQGQAAINSFNVLKENRFILGPLCNAASIPASKLAEEEQTIMITVGVSTRAIREAGDFSFTILPSIGLQTKALAEHMEDKGIGSVSIVYVNDEYGVENKETFENAYRGNILNAEAFDRSNADFRGILAKIKNDGSQAVVLVGYSPNFINIISQMKELDVGKGVFSVSNIQDPAIVAAAGNLTEGIIYTYPQISGSEEFTVFLDKYNKKFGKSEASLPMYVGAGYDAAKIMAGAVRKCGKNTECVKDELLEVKGYRGVNGIISIDENGNSRMPIELRIVRNGTFMKYEG